MPASSATPLPVSTGQVRSSFKGVDRYLISMAQTESPHATTCEEAVDRMLERYIRAAQYVIEEQSQIPFFVTRYCTRELASQASLTLGTDYDVEIMPMDYDVNQWRRASGRMELPHMPVISLTTLRLTLATDGQIADIPADWLNIEWRYGKVHVMPHALTSLAATFFTVFAIHPILYRPGLGSLTPLLVHVRYSAGLCERTAADGTSDFDPDEFPKNTRWDQHEVSDYQTAIEKLAAGQILSKLGPTLTRGGVSISVDGLSRSVNGSTPQAQADAWKKEAMEWAADKRRKAVGVGAVFA